MDMATTGTTRKTGAIRAFWRGFVGAGRHADEVLRLRDELKAERALNSEYNALVDELLTTLAEQRERINKQASVIEQYQALCEQKVKPLALEVLRWTRGQNHGFTMDAGDPEC